MTTGWKDRVKQAVSAGGTGALTLGAAASAYQAFGASDDGKVFGYLIEDGTAWEAGYGTYTHSGTSFARTNRDGSSTGSALNVSTSATLSLVNTARLIEGMHAAAASIVPGGVLTLVSGTPYPAADTIGATNLYYTPAIHGWLALWNGDFWQPYPFTEITIPVGTVTNAKGYDVFAYASSGAVAFETLAWTNDTTQATAVTLQDGRLCKSGAKTRLYVGSFRSTSATTTEDSVSKRFLYNAYNQQQRSLVVTESTDTWTYGSNTARQVNGSTANKVEMLLGRPARVSATAYGVAYVSANSSVAAKTGVGIDSTTVISGVVQGGFNAGASGLYAPITGSYLGILAAGYHAINWLEKGGDGTCVFVGDAGGDGQQTGLFVEVML